MGFRFRKSIKILPGLRLNLSKGGVSASVGVPGATVTVGKTGTRATVGLSGTGLSYSEKLSAPRPLPELRPSPRPTSRLGAAGWILLVLLVVVVGVLMAGCGPSAADCQANPECAYQACVATRAQMHQQGYEIANRMQCF